LLPDTVYHYRLVYGSRKTEDYHFRTFPLYGRFTSRFTPTTQDELPNYSQYERYKLLADRVAADPDIAFILSVGDQVNDGSKLSDWDRYFDAGRQLMARTTVYPALGNHETSADLYYSIFGLPAYYSFDCSAAHFTVLDSTDDNTEETAWLEQDLKTPRAWKFAAFHYPMYTSEENHYGGWLNLQAAWENILIEHNVAAVWNGHIHVYERYLQKGIHYLVMGTGGGPFGWLSEDKYNGYQNSLENNLAYARVTVDPEAGSTEVKIIRVADFSSVTSSGPLLFPPDEVYDSFSITSSPVWDLNRDRSCDFQDVAHPGQFWDRTGLDGWISADLNYDGAVNIGDVVFIGFHWGQKW
jgi:hypothetical protein